MRRTLISITTLATFVALAFGSSGSDDGVSATGSHTPLQLDQPSTITIEIDNTGTETFVADELRMKSDWARTLEITSSTPPIGGAMSVSDMTGDVAWPIAVTAPAGGKATVVLQVTPRVAGARGGSIRVCGVGCKSYFFSDEVTGGPDQDLLVRTVTGPGPVTIGDTFDVVFLMENNGILDDGLVSLSFDEEFIELADVVSAAPAAKSAEEGLLGGWSLDYEPTPVAGKSQLKVVMTARAKKAGQIKTSLNTCVTSEMLCSTVDFSLNVQ